MEKTFLENYSIWTIADLFDSVKSYGVFLPLAVPTGIEPARSNLGVTETLERIWAEKPLSRYFPQFTSLFVTFQVLLFPIYFCVSCRSYGNR